MGEHRYVALHHDPEKELFYSRRRNVMRRLDENVASVGEGENVPRSQAGHEIRHQMGVGSGDKFERNSAIVEL